MSPKPSDCYASARLARLRRIAARSRAARPSELLPGGSTFGRTPLVRLQRIRAERSGADIYVKCEWMNPAGSVKDRPALWMIRDAEARGLLRGGARTLLDSTSGNTGIALAQIAAARGHRVTLCMPANASASRKRLLRLLGAELVLTDALEGADGARDVARQLAEDFPERYLYLDQYSNPMNWRAHYESTAPEIWEQTEGRVTHFLAILGTSGTFTGVSRRLQELRPGIQCITVQPNAAYHGIEGTKHYASTEIPPIFDAGLVHRQVDVSTEEAQAMARRLACEEGLPAGTSGGAAVVAALKVAEGLDQGLLVTILPDNVMKSLGEASWDEGRP
ncbi:PLP-dependent cysteine synthase family protein [Geothrix sp. PMB-07]|uniref:PLP-dependent cysteine synthase family protein n=1 Tax=Geothrix sp. PMB-07 TaxID=3068640 RepID=UPI0027416869|nr:cysteine synthase family protein [Geothrix sp. PMB-07]WLT33485.1 cysteine synthase family protein [Geothrix sp. PMB-07]